MQAPYVTATPPPCSRQVLLVTIPQASLDEPRTGQSLVRVQTLFDADTAPSLVGDGTDFLRLCGSAGACVRQSRFFSLVLAGATLVGVPFTDGSFLSVVVGTRGTIFEVAYDAQQSSYSDVRFVYQSAAEFRSSQAPPAILPQCALPRLVGLGLTAYSGYSTSVFHTMRYSPGYIPPFCAPTPTLPPPTPPPSPQIPPTGPTTSAEAALQALYANAALIAAHACNYTDDQKSSALAALARALYTPLNSPSCPAQEPALACP